MKRPGQLTRPFAHVSFASFAACVDFLRGVRFFAGAGALSAVTAGSSATGAVSVVFLARAGCRLGFTSAAGAMAAAAGSADDSTLVRWARLPLFVFAGAVGSSGGFPLSPSARDSATTASGATATSLTDFTLGARFFG